MCVPRLTEDEIAPHLAKLPGWTRVGEAITKTYTLLGDCRGALTTAETGVRGLSPSSAQGQQEEQGRHRVLEEVAHDGRGQGLARLG